MRQYLVLLLLLLAFQVEAFGRPRSHKQNRKSVQTTRSAGCNPSASAIIKNSSTDNEEEITSSPTLDVDPYGNCGLVGFGVVQKIPYQSATSGSSPTEVNFSSACVRCGMCLAIAERINQTLGDAHDLMPSNEWLDGPEVDLFLRAICDNEFRHYTLRDINGERYIGDSLPGATLVPSNADGHWEAKLKSKCHDILDDVGTHTLYKHWREWCNGAEVDFDEILCRSDSGSLRDCRSIKGDGKQPDLCQNFYQAGIKVNAHLSCS